MIEHILKIYGINCNNKWIGYLTTGLTLSIFSKVVMPVMHYNNFSNKFSEIFFKTILSTVCVSKILNYFVIKHKSNNFFRLNYKLRNFQMKRSFGELRIYIYSAISLYLSIVISLLNTKYNFCEPYIIEILEDFNESMESLPIPPFSQIFLIKLYLYSWLIVIQFLYIEIKARYIAIIKDFNNELKSIVTKPDKNVIVLTQRTISKFIEFKDDIKRNVDFLKYEIFIELILPITAIVMVGSHGSIFDTKCHPFSISFIVLMIGSYLWTMSYDFRVKRTENDLILNINRWLNQKYEDSDQIEIKVLERTVKQFNEQKSIDESNST